MSTSWTVESDGPTGPERIIAGLAAIRRPVGFLAAVCLVITAGLILFHAPVETQMGEVQKIFYVHVPSWWTAFLGVTTVFLASVLLLLTRDRIWDEIASSAAEVAVLFLTIGIVTGPIWGKPIWGVWWTWDARLTTAFILWLVYVVYLLIRPMAEESERGARLAAGLGILGFLNIPIVHFSVLWWRTLHPTAIIMNPEDGLQAPSEMVQTLLFSFFTWTVVYLYLFARRVHIEHQRHDLEAEAPPPPPTARQATTP